MSEKQIIPVFLLLEAELDSHSLLTLTCLILNFVSCLCEIFYECV